jgi:alkanesulfonate monooxygenase SsuD/methylene tetrahydromethanopterin reductase-like flavin-dependent oxidoreductase (luciferase family)
MLQAAAISLQDSGVTLRMSRIDSTMLIIGSSLPNYWSLPSFMGYSLLMFSVSASMNMVLRPSTNARVGGYDVYKGPRNLDPAIISGAQWPVNEPLAVVPAMAAATKSIGFGVTVTTTYEQPYHLARRLSTIDHLTKGR